MSGVMSDCLMVPSLEIFLAQSWSFYQPATCKACGRLVLRLLYSFCVCLYLGLCVPTYHLHNNYITYIAAIWLDFIWLWQSRLLLCVSTCTMSRLASYECKIDTEKQRQCRRNDARLTKSRNARSEQLLVMPTESLTDWEWLPGELLSGLECSNVWLFLDRKH